MAPRLETVGIIAIVVLTPRADVPRTEDCGPRLLSQLTPLLGEWKVEHFAIIDE